MPSFRDDEEDTAGKTMGKPKQRRKRGRPPASQEDQKRDERIHDLYVASGCRTYLEYTQSCCPDLHPDKVKIAVQRHRVRLRRRSNSVR